MTIALLLLGLGLLVVGYGVTGGGASRARGRRLEALKARHNGADFVETQLRRISAQRASKLDAGWSRLLPNPQAIQARLAATGKSWTVGQYGMAMAAITLLAWVLLFLKGVPIAAVLLVGLVLGIGLPHLVVGSMGKKRIARFTIRFPDAIDLLVRGLRSGLPISETIGVVASEIPDPVGTEFRQVTDKMRIGKTMEGALQDTADRLGTPEFQFFVISLAIQRETGGNLAETLANLSDVLRKRMQMKLKVRAMSSESKASAYIIGALPFIVFGLIYYINPAYMGNFFTDPRLTIAAAGAGVWMGIGVFIMSKMINFEI